MNKSIYLRNEKMIKNAKRYFKVIKKFISGKTQVFTRSLSFALLLDSARVRRALISEALGFQPPHKASPEEPRQARLHAHRCTRPHAHRHTHACTGTDAQTPVPTRARPREAERPSSAATHQKLVLLEDGQLLGPLPEALFPQQEGTHPAVPDQVHGGLLRGPLVCGPRPFALLLLLVVGLVGAAHGLSILCKKTPGSRPCQVGDVPKEALLLPEGGRAAGRSSRWSPGHPRSPHP